MSATYWNVEVQTYRDGKPGTSLSTGQAQLADALALAIKEASFYRLCCGYEELTIELTEACAKCHNIRTIAAQGPRTSKRVRCPECHGKLPAGHIGPFPFTLHDNAVSDLQLS